ncbi:putative membrane copper amine oxidase, partial [Hortaea werneckii]
GDWARTDQDGPVLPLDDQSPPVAVTPAGARYSVDHEEQYVEWMGFSFYLSFSRDTGLSLFDIRHKGQRILYELGLQEALAHYAGNDPVQSGTSYLDTYYGFGPYALQLVPGYDCPSYATYMNTSYYVGETTHTHINSVCFFEFDADYPMQRHSTSSYVANTKNVYFSVRSVSTVGNYDYMFTYSFHMDGSIHVEVRASGYIQSAYYAHNADYGYHIHDYLSGSMHDHVLNYKADFDIFGTDNTMELTTNVPVTESYVWSDHPRNTMKLKRSHIQNEDESRLFLDFNSQTQYRIVNTDVRNKKDTEPRSAHPYNNQDVYNPVIDFDEIFNGENLEQEDLAVWFNLGMHHVPHTGDLPNTVFTTAHSGIQFMPLNYFDTDISKQTVNMVRINYNGGNVSKVKTFGQEEATCFVDLSEQEPDLSDYQGDVVIRKFPYNPNDPYFETDSIV